MVELLKFRHDRKADFKKSHDKIFQLIEKFGEQKELNFFYDHYEKRYSIPKEKLKFNLKRYILHNYKYKSTCFGKGLRISTIPFSIIKIMGFLFLSLLYSRKRGGEKHYKLMVDDIDMNLYLHRFSKLINLFGKENVIVIATGDIDENDFPNFNIVRLRRFKYHDPFESLKVLYHELFFGLWICLKVSIKMGINLFSVSMVIIPYLQYKSLFKICTADYLIQERLYATNAIKNYLFKESGGIATAIIQKSILELDYLSYYIDTDYFFSLGESTADSAFNYGARIDKIIPVGSMFMEYYWFNNPRSIEKNIDVIMIGINTMNEYERLDKYSSFMEDYYNSIRWLVRFKKDYPLFRVAIKHHSSAGEDEVENEILVNSKIEILPLNGNSYQFAFNSHCAITYGSTMGYEMNAHGVPTFFIDQGNRNTFLYDLRKIELFNAIRVSSYDSYRSALIRVLKNTNRSRGTQNKFDSLCVDSSEASNSIYNTFDNKNGYTVS